MSKKTDVKDFLLEILKIAGCKGIREGKDKINCSCPFHNPRKNENSFGVNFVAEDKGYPFKCMSGKCDIRGNIYQLIAHIYKCSYKKAFRIFEKRVLINPINMSILKELFNQLHNEINEINNQTVKFPPISKTTIPMMKYLKWRNENKQHNVMNLEYIIDRYKLYYCSEGRYMNRIIMPIKNDKGEWEQFNDRSVLHDTERKSLHTYGTDITNFIHGLSESSDKKKVIITEGSFDMFQVISVILRSSKLKGFGCVDCMGTLISEQRAILLSKAFEEAFILFDNDDAGVKAAFKAKCILDNDMCVHDITRNIPKKKDPAICTYGQIVKAVTLKSQPRLFYYKDKIK